MSLHRRVLIITYYWPPSGGSGVQRWLKMAKYMPQFGWDPIIYTPENPELMARDDQLLNEIAPDLIVWKRPIFEPYSLYKLFMGKKGETIKPAFISDTTEKTSLKERFALFIRSNLFFPDPRCFWRRPSVRYLRKKLQKEPVEWIITTGPPQSIHLIGKDLHRKTKIPWLADFRDPWTGIYYFKHLKMLTYTVKRHKRAEREVIREADVVTVVSPQMKREFLPLDPKHIEVIPNGYDESDFEVAPITFDNKFTICHTGLFTRDANPEKLWRALSKIISENEEFRERLHIVLVGHTDGAIRQSIEESGLLPYTQFIQYVPHLEAVAYQKGANLLLLALKKEPESKGIITGKFFEYLATRNPILGIGPVDGDLAKMLHECNAGKMCEFDDYVGIKCYVETQCIASVRNIEKQFIASVRNVETQFIASLRNIPPHAPITAYSRKYLCSKLAEFLSILHPDPPKIDHPVFGSVQI